MTRPAVPAVIPAPVSMTGTGDGLVVPASTFRRYTAVDLESAGPRTGADDLGEEGYRLRVGPDGVDLEAGTEAGLVRGVQTLVQLAEPLPGGAYRLPGVEIEDRPRYPWRGLMLDVARHFFGVDAIKHVIDIATLYKLNVLHLHLTDDQGWRLEIPGRPELTGIGGSTQVGDGPGGYLTTADYETIVTYARARHVTVVPEIDLPGHTNAALVAYPHLAPSGYRPMPYRGTEVGFSSLDAHNAAAYALVEDVVRELARIQPGGYVHIGGDEAHSTSDDDYRTFVTRALAVVESHGMRPIAWQEAVKADLPAGMPVQYWDTRASDHLATAERRGAALVMSPADHVYLDMKYEAGYPLGLDWAGHVDVRDAYDWDPAEIVGARAAVLGIEAALWTETITTVADIERMLLPRLPAVAERAWSPAESRDWGRFRARLGGHASLWDRLGVAYHPSLQVAWPSREFAAGH